MLVTHVELRERLNMKHCPRFRMQEHAYPATATDRFPAKGSLTACIIRPAQPPGTALGGPSPLRMMAYGDLRDSRIRSGRSTDAIEAV